LQILDFRLRVEVSKALGLKPAIEDLKPEMAAGLKSTI